KTLGHGISSSCWASGHPSQFLGATWLLVPSSPYQGPASQWSGSSLWLLLYLLGPWCTLPHQEQCHVQVSRSNLSRRRPQVDNPRTQLASHGISTISRVHRSSLAAISHLNLLVPRNSPSQEYCGGKVPAQVVPADQFSAAHRF